MKKFCHLFICGLLFSSVLFAQPATVREYKKVYKTYPFSDPNPIPNEGRIYPYFRFDGYTNTPISKEWKVVEMENAYLKVQILPEIGGKIWAAFEKSTGKSFIYNNEVVKFRDIAMRGPWTSGGIEANYGIIGHTPAVANPVDYQTFTNADGSVSCVIGTLDLLTRTNWRLEINLPKDKAYFTTRSFWYNSTNLEQPYYSWMNVGIKAAGNLEFSYAGTKFLGHDGEVTPWKMTADGRDRSFYEQNNFGGYKSYHVFGTYTDFYGGYYHNEDFGMGRYASHDDKLGKKIWIWGLSQQGMIWDKLLTDTNGQYVEVQSGRLFNQSGAGSVFTPFKHRGFLPAQSDSWTEYWFPVKGTKGITKANPWGSLNVAYENGSLKLYFCPLQAVRETLTVKVGDTVMYQKVLNLRPMQIFTDKVDLNTSAMPIYTVTLGNNLTNKLVYSSDPSTNNLARPTETPADFDWNSVQGLYLQGKNWMHYRDYVQAEQKLNEALAKDPNFMPALTDLAQLAVGKRNYTRALDLTKSALSVDTYDAAANYVYGVANRALGKIVDAKDGFDVAAQSVEYRSAAYTELASIYFTDAAKEAQMERAENYAQKALDFNQQNIEALQLLAVLHRVEGNRAQAASALSRIRALDPLSHFVRFEQYLAQPSLANQQAFTRLIRNEMPQETYLEMALWYIKQNRLDEAISLLNLAPVTPELQYWLGYLAEQRKQSSQAYLQKALSLSPLMQFPFRPESLPVLEWALKKSKRWETQYYIGLIEWGVGDLDAAKSTFRDIGETPNFAPFYATRAKLNEATDLESSIRDLNRAMNLDGHEWRYGQLLAKAYITQKSFAKARQTAQEYAQHFPENYLLGMLYAKTLLLNEQYEESLSVLNATKVLPNEGAVEGRQLFHEANMQLAIRAYKAEKWTDALKYVEDARLYPENLGVGKPYDADIDVRLEDYLAALCLTKLGETRASALFQKVASAKVEKSFAPNDALTVLLLRQVNKSAEAEAIVQHWGAQNAVAQVMKSLLEGGSTTIPEDILGDEAVRLLVALLKR